jgi:UDP-N-acetylmuramoylalanine--D-glutamate ligase
MQEVARVAGVCFVNDSKATNPGAALRALAGAGAPVVWIAGGRDKGFDFKPLADAALRHLRAAVLLGEAKQKLAEALGARVETLEVATIEDAVRAAAQRAKPGDVVLLAPACASFDQFESFEHRGDEFRRLVEELR